MSNSDLVLELLDDIQPIGYCDDCLSRELGIQPRQQVNQICHRLEDAGKIIRQKAVCASCQKRKVINTMNITPDSDGISTPKVVRESSVAYRATPTAKEIDIEHTRTQIVQICRQVWAKRKPETPPHSISVLINTLKGDNLLPSHQANMMLTLCNLRNVYVYGDVAMGRREVDIAINALGIVEEWWSKSGQ